VVAFLAVFENLFSMAASASAVTDLPGVLVANLNEGG
jgi:hypothetical protein